MGRNKDNDFNVHAGLVAQAEGAKNPRPSVLDGSGFDATRIEYTTGADGKLVSADEADEIVLGKPARHRPATPASNTLPDSLGFGTAAAAAGTSQAATTKSPEVMINYIWANIQEAVMRYNEGNLDRAQTVFDRALKERSHLMSSPALRESPTYKGYLRDLVVLSENGNKQDSLGLTVASYKDAGYKVPKFSEYVPGSRASLKAQPPAAETQEPLL